MFISFFFFFFSSRRRHTRCYRDWSSDVCSSDLVEEPLGRLHLRDRRADSGILEDGDAPGALRQDQDAAEAGRARIVLSKERKNGRLPGSRAQRQGCEPVRLSDFEGLAAGQWAIHHISGGVYEESGDGEAQRRDVPDGG